VVEMLPRVGAFNKPKSTIDNLKVALAMLNQMKDCDRRPIDVLGSIEGSVRQLKPAASVALAMRNSPMISF
jgi:hypothetical protein